MLHDAGGTELTPAPGVPAGDKHPSQISSRYQEKRQNWSRETATLAYSKYPQLSFSSFIGHQRRDMKTGHTLIGPVKSDTWAKPYLDNFA